MKKIPTLFVRDENDRKHVTREVNPECKWVIDGDGTPTRKFDGTCCLVQDGKLYKRYELKPGKTPPNDFEPADHFDRNTGKQPEWVPVGDGPEDKFHHEAWDSWKLTAEVDSDISFPPPDGTYELVGPKVQGNPEGYSAHCLISHETETAFEPTNSEPPRDFDGLRDWLLAHDYEGIVWHHPDGRMAKIKKRDVK